MQRRIMVGSWPSRIFDGARARPQVFYCAACELLRVFLKAFIATGREVIVLRPALYHSGLSRYIRAMLQDSEFTARAGSCLVMGRKVVFLQAALFHN